MIKTAKKITILGAIALLTQATPLTAENQITKSSNEEIPTVSVKKAEPNLVADRAKKGNNILAVDSVLMQIGLEAEEQMYPANDIYYGRWDNEYVKAYGDLAIPDTFQINVSEFVNPIEGRVTSRFGPRKRRMHYGIDIALSKGDTIRAAFDGKVRVKKYERKGYGYYLVLRHNNGLETVYGHLSKFLVEENQTIEAGQPIALGGNTGRSTGPHLHFEFRFLGTPINPEEIVDYDQFCTKDEMYVFSKSNCTKSKSKSASSTKYTANSSGKVKYYKIKQGDTLGTIARKNGTTVNKICKLNNIKPTTTLRIGKSLRLS